MTPRRPLPTAVFGSARSVREAPARTGALHAPAESPRAVDLGARKRSLVQHPFVTWSGWLMRSDLAALWVLGPVRPAGRSMGGMSMGPTGRCLGRQCPGTYRDCSAPRLPPCHGGTCCRKDRSWQQSSLRSRSGSLPSRASHMRLIGGLEDDDRQRTSCAPYQGSLVARLLVPEHVFFRRPRKRGHQQAQAFTPATEQPSCGQAATTAPSSWVDSPPAELAAIGM